MNKITPREFVNVNIAFASFLDGERIGQESIDTSGNEYMWAGTVLGWIRTAANGAAHVTDPSLTMIKYTGSGYTYICEAAIGTARSTAGWRVLRITDATGDTVYAGTGLFAHAATSLAVVAALTYTLGA